MYQSQVRRSHKIDVVGKRFQSKTYTCIYTFLISGIECFEKIPFRNSRLSLQILSTSLQCEIRSKDWSQTLNWYYSQGIGDYSLATPFSSCLLLLLTDTVHTKGRFPAQEWELCVLTASVRCDYLDCGYLHVNLGPTVCLQTTEKELVQAADSGEPVNPSAVSTMSNKSSTTLQCTTCIDWISADLCCVRVFHIPELKQCSLEVDLSVRSFGNSLTARF